MYCGAGRLPNPRGRAGGACTSALLEILHQNVGNKLSFQQVLMSLRDKLGYQGYSQIPQLTSSRPLDLDETPFTLHASPTGARRALLVGINYQGQSGELRGCHNDVYHMHDYLVKVHGFPPRDILVLLDDGQHHSPSREKIIRALRHLVAASRPGDAVFFHYSGHGGLLSPDFNSFKSCQKEYDQTLIPVDHKRSGQIRDFSLFHHFVQPMPAGVKVTCLIDSCHSGSVLDLPYSFRPTKTARGSYTMQENVGIMSNLAFLYMLAGGVLPQNGLFQNIAWHLQNNVDGELSQYQGVMGESLAEDMEPTDAPGHYGQDYVVEDSADLDAMGMGDDMGDTDVGEENNFVRGDNVAQGFEDSLDYGNAVPVDDDDGFTFDSYAEGAGIEGCGDEGCGDLIQQLADCVNDLEP